VAEPAATIVEIVKGYNACLCRPHAKLFLQRLVVDRCEDGPCEMCVENSNFTLQAADLFLRKCARSLDQSLRALGQANAEPTDVDHLAADDVQRSIVLHGLKPTWPF
jgi:hypothetical protein